MGRAADGGHKEGRVLRGGGLVGTDGGGRGEKGRGSGLSRAARGLASTRLTAGLVEAGVWY